MSETFRTILYREFMFHMIYVIEGQGALVNEKGEETPLKAGDFALVNPSEKHQYRNKGDQPFKMICGVPKEFE
jgi:quercetin dioxygenase-like cupin family protein